MAGSNVMLDDGDEGLDLERVRSRVDARVAERRGRHLRIARGAGAGCLLVLAVTTWSLTRPSDPDRSVDTTTATTATTAERAADDDGASTTAGPVATTAGTPDPGATGIATTAPADPTTTAPAGTADPEPGDPPPSPTVPPAPIPHTGTVPPSGTGPVVLDPPDPTEPATPPATCQAPWGPAPTLAYVGNFNGQRVQNTGASPITIEEPVLLVLVDGAGAPASWGIWTAPQRTTVIAPGQTVDVLYDFGEDECRYVDGRETRGAMVLRGTVDGRTFQAVVPYSGPAGT